MNPWPVHERDTVELHGEDSVTFLHSQVSQDISALVDGDSAWTLVLAPTGKVEALARVRRVAPGHLVVDVDAGYGPGLLARLNRFRIRVRAELSAGTVMVAVPGHAGLAGRPEGIALAGWWDGDPHVLVDEVPAPDDDAEFDLARVTAGWPAMGAEILPGETIPAETGLAAVAVNFAKGCYPGQELVERMESRGARPPRSLKRLTVAEGARPGDPVMAGDKQIGLVTSVAGTRALGYVNRSAHAAIAGDPC